MEQTVNVLKFGGTSVGNGERIRRVAAIIADTVKDAEKDAEAHFPVMVVSAMSGVTDQVLRIARAACAGEREICDEELAALRQKHREAAEKVTFDDEGRVRLLQELETGP